MRCKGIVMAAALLCWAGLEGVGAIEDGHREQLDRFFQYTRAKERYEQGLLLGFEAAHAIPEPDKLPPDLKEKYGKAQGRGRKLLLEELGWEKVKGEIREMYAKKFTAQELRDLNNLFEHNLLLVQLWEKEQALLPDMVKFSQEKLSALMPRMMEVMTGGVEDDQPKK